MNPIFWLVFLLILSIAGCQAPPPEAAADVSASESAQSPPDDIEITDGQTVYVPVYSHAYWTDRKEFPLAVTLNVRNTDPEHGISIVDVDYYDSDGTRLERYLSEPMALAPLASAEFFVDTRDRRGGSGANFIVRWESGSEVYEPVVEAVMLATAGTQGISFLSRGMVYQERK